MTVTNPPPGRRSSTRYGPTNPQTGKRTLLPCPKCGCKRCECHERKALKLWDDFGVPTPIRQYPFASPAKRWMADFAWVDQRVLVEIDGSGGRHHTEAGFRDDCVKTNAAAMLGWKVIRLTRDHLSFPRDGKPPYAVRAVKAALEGGYAW